MNTSTPESPNQAPISPDKAAFLARFQASVDATMRQLELNQLCLEIVSGRVRETRLIIDGMLRDLHAMAPAQSTVQVRTC